MKRDNKKGGHRLNLLMIFIVMVLLIGFLVFANKHDEKEKQL